MFDYNFTYEYNSYYQKFIIFNKKMPINRETLLIIFNISYEKMHEILNQIEYKEIISNNIKLLLFFTEHDAKFFIQKLEAELLIQILQGKTEELTVSQMIKLL